MTEIVDDGLLNQQTWTPARTLTFARGLYHVAACDGVAPQEEALIRRFLRDVGLPDDLAPLGATPFDYAEAAEALDSMWLRRLLIAACRTVVLADGKVSEQERDCMRAMAAALGLGEQIVTRECLPPIQGEGGAADLARWIATQPVDHVSWDDEAQAGYFWQFPHTDHPAAHGGRLEIARGQHALVAYRGAVTDALGPGDHAVTPGDLPGLAAAAQWREGAIWASFVFISSISTPLQRWGTTDPIVVQDPQFGELPLRAFGRFSLKIVDPRAAWTRFGRQGPLPADVFEARLRRIVAGRFGEAFRGALSAGEGLIDLLSDPQRVIGLTRPLMDERLQDSGLALTRLYLENITAPEAVQRHVTVRSSYTSPLPLIQATGAGMSSIQVSSVSTPALSESSRTTGQALYPCPQCEHPVPMSARFCSHCGQNLRRPCVRCHEGISLKARFCPTCGTQQPQEISGDEETLPDD